MATTRAEQIERLQAIISSAENVNEKFQKLRNSCSDEQWDKLEENQVLADLLSSLADLEYELEK